MVNKSENTKFNAMVSVDAASKAQSVVGNLVDVSNVLESSISTLPCEMIYRIGTFLKLKDKISFSQALVDAGLVVSLDYREILAEFNNQFLTQKIDILLEGKKQHYNFSKFYALEAQNEDEVEGVYSLLFQEMCDSFKSEKLLAEKIASLVDKLDPEALDADRIKLYVDREDSNAKKDVAALISHLFPSLTDQKIIKEIEHRVQLFDARANGFSRQFSEDAETVTADLLAFIKMEEKYRGVPIELIARAQKLTSSNLLPVIQSVKEKMQAMPTEALRALLIMALDESQREDFCEKMIELGARDNPFYSKGSPYFSVLKSDLLYLVNITKPNRCLLFFDALNYQTYILYVAYHADDVYLREHADNLINRFLDIQKDLKTESQRENLAVNSLYDIHIQSFYHRMEQAYGMKKSLEEELEKRVLLLGEASPEPDKLDSNSPEYLLSCVARRQISLHSIMKFLKANPHHVNAQNSNGDTLLHLLIKQSEQSEDIAELLSEFNFDLKMKNREGVTPLMLAVQLEDMLALNVLLKQQGLDVNQPDNYGNTALHHAVLSNKRMAMHRLLRYESTDVTIANSDKKTPCELAGSLGLSSLFNSLSFNHGI